MRSEKFAGVFLQVSREIFDTRAAMWQNLNVHGRFLSVPGNAAILRLSLGDPVAALLKSNGSFR